MFKNYLINGVIDDTKKIIKDKNNNNNIIYKINDVIISSWNNIKEYSKIHVFTLNDSYYSVEHMLDMVFKENDGADYIEKYCKKYYIEDICCSNLLTVALKALNERYMITYEDMEILFYIVYIYKKYEIKPNDGDVNLFINLLNDTYNDEFKLLIIFIITYLYGKNLEKMVDRYINPAYVTEHDKKCNELNTLIYNIMINKDFIQYTTTLYYHNSLLSTLLTYCMDNKIITLINVFKQMLYHYVNNIEELSYKAIDSILVFIKYTKNDINNNIMIKNKLTSQLYNKLMISTIIDAKRLPIDKYNYYKNILITSSNKELREKAKKYL